MLKQQILVGADPELFMQHPDSLEFVSAHGRVPGTKQEPYKVPYGAIQVDGTALEFNIDPAATVQDFVRNIKAVRNTLEHYVPGYNVVAEPVAMYTEDYLRYDVPPEALELGCEPDYNGWSGDQNPRPDPGTKPMRTASGHVHIGWGQGFDAKNPEHFAKCCKVARQMDYYLGIQSLIWDQDGTRRELYGKAGAFRPKPYGMEYRVLSNRWLSSDALMAWVYNAVQLGMDHARLGRWAENVYGDVAQNIINNNNTKWEDQYLISLDLEKVPA